MNNKFNIGDTLWWFECSKGGHWSVRFFHDDLWLCSGVYEGITEDGYAKIKDEREEYSCPHSYYSSKEEAINCMIQNLKEILRES